MIVAKICWAPYTFWQAVIWPFLTRKNRIFHPSKFTINYYIITIYPLSFIPFSCFSYAWKAFRVILEIGKREFSKVKQYFIHTHIHIYIRSKSYKGIIHELCLYYCIVIVMEIIEFMLKQELKSSDIVAYRGAVRSGKGSLRVY